MKHIKKTECNFLLFILQPLGNGYMKRAILERNIVVVLFVLVLVVFSFAERDSKKLDRLYTKGAGVFEPSKKAINLASAELFQKKFPVRITRN